MYMMNDREFSNRKETLHGEFYENALKYPERIALIYENEKVSYKMLRLYALRAANYMWQRGVRRNDKIVVILPRGIGQVAALLGILAIGAAYVPIAMKQPLGRRKKIIENVKPALVLQDEAFLEENPWTGCIENNSKDTAYIIYTSGSSGEPKGVEMSHVAAMNTIEEILHMWNIGAEDSVLNISAFDFDLSVFDIFGLLTVGGTIVLIDEDDFRDPEVWKNLIEIYGITIWNSAPALLDMFLIMGGNNHFGKLRLALVSGDWIPLYLPEKWYKVTSANSQFVALGGATEGGIWSNYYCVSKVDKLWNSIPYGQALPKQKYRITDENFVECGVDIPGELQIGGGSLAKGYINDEELTMKKFITDVKGERWYRTGDRGRRWADGTIEFLGRMDTQVKIRGHPLEIIVPSASKKKVICERNKGITNQSRIQQRFVKYAKKNSNKTAVIDAVETVTYGELLERAEYIAGYLRKEFVENRTGLVAIRMKKSVNQIAAVMGVLIAGFSYLPIDIKQPLARQEKILSKANVIVELDEKKVNMILQNLEYRLEKHPEFQNPIAYVIFTSGSTGEPKGVVMSHTAAQNTLISIENMYNISEEDTILGIAELSFDLSVFDIFSVLGVGGTLVLPNPEKGPDASHWGRLLNEYKVTLWNSVPAQAEMLDAFASKSESYPTVRLVLLSGDWINTSLPGRLRKIMTNAQMISLGGATEGGIWSIYHEIDEIEERPTILYGKALFGQWMGVVDEELRICPEYVSGQIAIGGYSLAEGYLGDTILTKEKFVYLEEEKNRIYLTGDNGRYVENGDIEFLGRLDNQVKINGHRIEIAEIENAIRGMQNIEDCCVVYNQSIGKGVLIAFIKNKISSISYTKEEYRKQLAFFLPPAMIPSEFVNVESFPLSTNGKIDRKGLAESIQKNIKVKHNAKATLISQKKEYVELAKSIKKIVCSISGNDYIDYEDNLLENGLDSLLLSQISGRIVSDIQEAQGMRFDEILRASLTMPTIMGIAQYISDCKNPSKNQMHSNAGNQTRNSYTVVYIFGDNENEIRDVLIEKLSASNISCKRVGGQEIIERCHEDINVKKKYIIAFSEMASLCITKASELLGENIIINRIFLINPSKAKESDLYLGDISIIDGNSVAIKSWEKAVLGNVREFESNSNDIFDIIMRELENDK